MARIYLARTLAISTRLTALRGEKVVGIIPHANDEKNKLRICVGDYNRGQVNMDYADADEEGSTDLRLRAAIRVKS